MGGSGCINEIRFEDGAVWNPDHVKILTTLGMIGDDHRLGGGGNDTVEQVFLISEDYDFIVYKNGNTILIENMLTKVHSFNSQITRNTCYR